MLSGRWENNDLWERLIDRAVVFVGQELFGAPEDGIAAKSAFQTADDSLVDGNSGHAPIVIEYARGRRRGILQTRHKGNLLGH